MAKRMDIDTARSYATKDRLIEAIENKYDLRAYDYLVVCNTRGRFTAIFPTGWNSQRDATWWPIRCGFMVVG